MRLRTESRAGNIMPGAANHAEENDPSLQDDVDWRCDPQGQMFLLPNGDGGNARQISP